MLVSPEKIADIKQRDWLLEQMSWYLADYKKFGNEEFLAIAKWLGECSRDVEQRIKSY